MKKIISSTFSRGAILVLVMVGMMLSLEGCATVPLTPKTMNRTQARKALIKGDVLTALLAYQHITANGADAALAAEYAYVLAVAGYWDAAYQQIDRARQMNGMEDEVWFFTHRIFLLTGHKDLADAIGPKKLITPQWIKKKIDEVEGYCRGDVGVFKADGEKEENHFAQANVLAKQNFLLSSVIAFDRFLESKPKDPAGHLGYSIVLEKLGAYGLASKEAAKARDLLDGKPGSDVLEQRVESLDKLEQTSDRIGPASPAGRWFIFGGGQLASVPGGYEETLSASVGKFITSQIDVGVNFNYSSIPAYAGVTTATTSTAATSASSVSNLGVTGRFTPRLVSEDKDNINLILGGDMNFLNGADFTGTVGLALQGNDGETDLTCNADTTGLFGMTLGFTAYIGGI